MGKSYKKNVIYTDSSKKAKKASHGRFRKLVKQKIQENRFDELPEDEREITNSYDVIDQRWIFNEEDDYYDKVKRK